MEEKKELNLSDAQLEEIAGGLNKQQIKDAEGKVIKFGKNNVKEILLAATAVTSAAALAVSLSTKYDYDRRFRNEDKGNQPIIDADTYGNDNALKN